MREKIRNFPEQFNWQPKIINGGKLKVTDKFVICGMGGSHLAGGLLKTVNPYLDLLIHKDYGLPRVPEYFLRESLLIFSSYSGNTEEVIDGLEKAQREGLQVAILTTGGKLLEIAEKNNLPYIKMPEMELQPRMALGYSLLGILKLTGQEEMMKQVGELKGKLDIEVIESEAINIAKKIVEKIPVIYSSTINRAIALNWKIKLNETGKIPAWYNLVPELNHNEMAGFDYTEISHKLSKNNIFIILRDDNDKKRIQIRFDVLEEILKNKDYKVLEIKLAGKTVWEKIFRALLLADFIALEIAEKNGAEPEAVLMVEKFKERMLE